jgi:hypothetical protein
MSDYLPLFPLKLVAFPGEHLNLHIFEPRYRQLIKDLVDYHGRFGIVVYLDKLMVYGTELELQEICTTYEDGRLDIKTKGKRIFKLLSFENPMPDKLYAGGEVSFEINDPRVPENVYNEFLFYLKELFRLMNHKEEIKPFVVDSFYFAHKIGLKIEEEYELIQFSREVERLQYLTRHMMKVIPILREIEIAKKKINMNGHFKNLDPLNF